MTLHLVGNWPSDTGYAWKMIERLWIALANAYPGKTIITFPKVTTLSPELRAAGIEVIEFNFDLGKPKELLRFVRQHQVRHLYLSDRNYVSPVYPRLRLAGVHSITMHDHMPGTRTLPGAVKRFGKAMAVRLMGADTYIATAPLIRERHLHVVCAPAKRCVVAQNGIEPIPYQRADSTIRQELGIAEEVPLIASCSRTTAYKRIHLIVEAAALVRAIHPEACFIHLGKGPDDAYFQELQALIHSQGLAGTFRLLGDRNDVTRILPGCDIGVLASQGEGYSLATLEMMSAGLPMVISDDPSVAGCVEDGVTGLHFPAGSAADLALKLRFLIADRDMRQRLGESARQVVDTRYRLEGTIKATVAAVAQYW